ncbi:hypothetical protein T440DRAFT_109850 [Plenodomus tracheiphilus IPT5]|uniref:Uncharacterized protein n=1 Tax=Plenodomus tracheiphilus IPT5 TaxID=1408161 RepID=A0A6A7B4X2_9PLEO|nr:hypothetical protein T440DRAFT_109850 [Plenodomus tracheiphilus IPT5]
MGGGLCKGGSEVCLRREVFGRVRGGDVKEGLEWVVGGGIGVSGDICFGDTLFLLVLCFSFGSEISQVLFFLYMVFIFGNFAFSWFLFIMRHGFSSLYTQPISYLSLALAFWVMLILTFDITRLRLFLGLTHGIRIQPS